MYVEAWTHAGTMVKGARAFRVVHIIVVLVPQAARVLYPSEMLDADYHAQQ